MSGSALAGSVRALAVVVPVHDEQDRIAACLRSIRVALDRVDRPIAVTLRVVLDRCTDATPAIVAAHLTDWPAARVLVVDRPGPGEGVGALRDRGIRDALAGLAVDPSTVWLLGTDADTTVPPDWALAHLRAAGCGAVGVAGRAELAGTAADPDAADPAAATDIDEPLGPLAAQRYRALLAATDRHVWAANLGVRADAYLAAGGFPRHGSGEEHGLWDRLRAAGHRLQQPGAVAVRTSARRRGRAVGGLADLLAELSEPSRPGLVAG